MPQPGFFDVDDRFNKLNERDALLKLDQFVDWELFRPTLDAARPPLPPRHPGRRPFDNLLMFKGLLLQHLYNLSDEELEFQIRDRFTFMRFLGLSQEAATPDRNTFWDFRERLTRADVIKTLFTDFERYLQDKGYAARKGQIVDASFVEAPRQRNSREENAAIKRGEIPTSLSDNPHCMRQKDTDARWTKKNYETYYGYKDHVSVDVEHKLIRDYQVTPASVHDSHALLDILAENTSRQVWADSAYRSEETERLLERHGYQSHIHERGSRNKPLTAEQRETNREKSRIRARVEHVFGSMTNEQDGMHVRVIGIVRARTRIGLTNLVYNVRRFVSLCRIHAPAAC